MLQGLGAEDELEALVGHGDLLDRPLELRRGVRDVHADILGDGACEEGLVRLGPAADVEQPRPSLPAGGEAGFLAQPARQRGTHGVRGGAELRVSPPLAGISHERRVQT